MVKPNNLLDNLSIAYWNIDGMFTRIDGQRSCKLDNVEFQQQATKFDIICLVETHCSMNDDLSLDNFHIYQNIRPKSANAPRHFGGISICIRNSIRKGIKLLPITNSEVSWLKLCKHLFNLEQDIYLAVAYVSPAGSSFSEKRDNIFEILENDISNYSKKGACFVCGDFNAKTAQEPDFCIENADSDTHITLPDDYIYDLPIKRNNMDIHKLDDYGKQLLSLCKTSGLRILNGRILGDLLGHCTCFSHNGKPSTIDYMLAGTSILNLVNLFHVNPPNELSIHCLLCTSIKINAMIPAEIDDANALLPLPGKYLWAKDSEFKFQSAMTNTIIKNKIDHFLNGHANETVDQAVESVNDIIKCTANIAGIKLKKSSPHKINKLSKKNKKWYDDDCRILLRELRKAGKAVRKNPNDANNLHHFNKTRKKYKKLLKTKKLSFRKNLVNQFDNLAENNQQEFWSLYNKLIDLDKQTKKNPIPPQQWVNHFSKLLDDGINRIPNELNDQMDSFLDENTNTIFNELNFKITTLEISKAIKKLKQGVSCGLDEIPNEMLKAGHSALLPVLQKMFNFILSNEHCPQQWRFNTLTPLHKKGDSHDTQNYRGIAVCSSLCKLFCAVLHNRLTIHIKNNNLMPAEQIGYQKNSRTADHVLTLKTIIDKYIQKASKLRIYACFVDFKKAFDSISRRALFYKLLKRGVGGNFLRTLQSLYKEVFYHIKLPEGLTEYVNSSKGVKQGCVLSPSLFNLFISDLPAIFDDTCNPASLHNKPVSCLMFADDLVLISLSISGLQTSLNKLEEYCTKWNLNINHNKTKIIIFNKAGHCLRHIKFSVNGQLLEVCSSYMYLGVIFTPCGSFTKAVDHLTDQAMKALFKLKQKDIRDNVYTGLKLFDTLIMPIIRYCAEVWSPYYIKNLNENNFLSLCEKFPGEKIHMKFNRYLFRC